MAFDLKDNLILISLREFSPKRRKSQITINEDSSLFDIICLLYSKLLGRKAKQQVCMESKRRIERGDQDKSMLCESEYGFEKFNLDPFLLSV
jgi:hypothetical protein